MSKEKKVIWHIPIISILSLVLIVLLICIVVGISKGDVRRVNFDESDMLHFIKYENYDQLSYYIKENRFLIKDRNSEYLKFEAVADYMDNLTFANAYEKAGRTEEASKCREAMEKAKEGMKDYAYVTDILDERAGRFLH